MQVPAASADKLLRDRSSYTSFSSSSHVASASSSPPRDCAEELSEELSEGEHSLSESYGDTTDERMPQLASFRGAVHKRESVTQGVIGKMNTLVPRTVPEVVRRPVILEVSEEGVSVHDIGEKAMERSVTSGKVHAVRVPLEYITGWQCDESRRKVVLVLSKDHISTFARLRVQEIDAGGVRRALEQHGRAHAAKMAAELVLQREGAEERRMQQQSRLSQRPMRGSIGIRRSVAPSRISRLGSLFSVRRSSNAAQHSSFESIDEHL